MTRAKKMFEAGYNDYIIGTWPDTDFYYHADAANYEAGWEAARNEHVG